MRSVLRSWAFIAALLAATVSEAAVQYQYERTIGRPPSIGEPITLAVDADETVYVADRTNAQIIAISASGTMRQLPNTGRLKRPTAVAVLPDKTLFVVDEADGGRVVTYDVQGSAKKSSALSGAGGPSGVAVDAQQNVYISDQFRNVVNKYSPAGALISTLGRTGDEAGSFRGPRGLAIDRSGNLYVADEYNNRIQKFSSDGKLLGTSSPQTLGVTISEGLGPMSVAVDSKGGIWVAAHTNFQVYKLSPTFQLEVRLDSFGRRPGELAGPVAVAVDLKDNVYVLDRSRRVQKFSSSGEYISKYEFPPAALGELSAPIGVVADAGGNLYVADDANFRVQKFAPDGTPLLAFGAFGHGPGEFNGVESLTIDSDGNLWAVDSYNHRVQKFTPEGKFLLSVGSFGKMDAEFSRTKVIDADIENEFIYVNDWHNARVQKFDLNGKFLGTFGDTGPDSTRVHGPTGLTVDRAGNVYVSSWFNNAIQKFDVNGKFVQSIGKEGTGDGQFKGPARLAIDAEGNLVVADWGNSRIQTLTPDGRFVSKLGGPGRANGAFDQPVGVTVDRSGNLFVSDPGNSRVQRFRATGAVPVARSAKAEKTAAVTTPAKSETVFVQVALFDVKPEAREAFEAALREQRPAFVASKSFINDRVLRNIDELTLQYATYTKFADQASAEKLTQDRVTALAKFCRRTPEVHLTRQTHAYSPVEISHQPNGREYAEDRKGQIAHLGMFIPLPRYRAQYEDVLTETKMLTRERKPRGYIGEDLLVELEAPEPARQAPYSPRPQEPSPMSINYGEYNTMEDAEDSYITRQVTRDPKLVTMERTFFSSLQVPTRFYIFQVIDNYTGGPSSQLTSQVK